MMSSKSYWFLAFSTAGEFAVDNGQGRMATAAATLRDTKKTGTHEATFFRRVMNLPGITNDRRARECPVFHEWRTPRARKRTEEEAKIRVNRVVDALQQCQWIYHDSNGN